MDLTFQNVLNIWIYAVGCLTIGGVLGSLAYRIWHYFNNRKRLDEKIEVLRDRISRIEKQLNIH